MTTNGAAAYPLKVTLAEHTYEVFPQRHAYLTHRLEEWMQRLQGLESVDTDRIQGLQSFVSLLGDRAYELLKVLIPDLMPEYEFMGYATDRDYENADYDPTYDKSPTFPEIVTAFDVTLTLNKLDTLKKVTGLVDPRVIRAWVTQQIGSFLVSTTSASSSADATGGPPTTSGIEAPTSAASTA